MKDRIAELTPRQIARIAGVLYLTIIVAGIFAEFFVRTSLFVPGDVLGGHFDRIESRAREALEGIKV